MKRFGAMLVLTIPEQRVVIFLLLALVAFATWKTRRSTAELPATAASLIATPDQPSPSPGTGP